VICAFLPWVGEGTRRPEQPEDRGQGGVGIDACSGRKRREYKIITGMIRPGTKVLDLGCGSGELLSILSRERNVSGLGVDIDIDHVVEVIERGHDIFQDDIDAGLAMIPDGSYDYAILSETLQVVRRPRFVLREMLRVAREGVVSFPNFGKWTHRLNLWISGRMPKDESLPFEWYDTPNIHLFTLKDFVEICREDNIEILKMECIPEGRLSAVLVGMGLNNLGADRVLARIARGKMT